MPIFTLNQRRILFIHVPKTGGTALSRLLAEHGRLSFDTRIETGKGGFLPRHQSADVLTQIFEAGMFDWAFMVTRHPVQRLMSEFRYQARKPGLHLTRMIGFAAWLRYSLARARAVPAYRGNHFRPQTDFEAFGCSVFALEDGLDKPLAALAARTGMSFPRTPARQNASPMRKVVPSAGDLDLIARTYQSDFQRYGYDIRAADRMPPVADPAAGTSAAEKVNPR